MTVDCQFTSGKKGTACRACGYALRYDYSSPPARSCPGGPCVHLGEDAGEMVGVTCIDCKGKPRTVHHVAHECRIFGRCLPHYRCTKDALSESTSEPVAVCFGCDRFTTSPQYANR